MFDTYFNQAASDALKGIKKGDGGPFGALIVKNKKIISVGHNTVLKTKNPIRHAEINTIEKAAKRCKSFDLSGCTIISTTEPCPMCFSAIHWARIKQIVYATTITDVKQLGFNELLISNQKLKRWGNSKIKITRIPHATCTALLKAWKHLPHRKTY